MKTTFKKTAILRPVEHGLVDYIATGYITRDQEDIPCEIGYTEFTNSIQPTHIFIKAGVTASGTHFEDETIEL